MPNRFHGEQREKILRRLVDEWLPSGPPVAILQGFPGCGKSQLASAVAEKATRSLDPIVVQSDWADPLLDLFVEPVIELTPGLPECSGRGAMLPASIRCLILGRAEDYTLKGLDFAARALGRVVERWRSGNPPKLIVRGAPAGTGDALRERIIRDGQPASLDVVVRHYTPDETEIRNDLREASLVLMPSQKEGFGLVGLEAVACGVPTLISDQSGLAETLKLHAPRLANEWILPVTGDAVMKWAERIEFLLTGREGAFARAAALREQLATRLDWLSGATSLLDRLCPNRNSHRRISPV